MLAEAHKLIQRRGRSNVTLLQEDATKLQLDRELRARGRVVVMDMGLTRAVGTACLTRSPVSS